MLSGGIKGYFLTIFLSLITIFDLISYVLYILLIIFLIKKLYKKENETSSEFHTLIVFNAILDILFITEEYISYRIPQFGIFSNFYQNIFSNIFISGICYIYSLCHVNFIFLSGITITFNRFYAIKYPMKYKYFWRGWKLLILMIWPSFIVIPFFIKYYSVSVQYVADYTGRQSVIVLDSNSNNAIWQFTSYIHCISLAINGILTIFLIRLLKINLKDTTFQNKSFKVDLLMTKYAIIYFLLFSFVVIVEILMTIASNLEYFEIANDLLTLTVLCQSSVVFFPLYGLFILSKEIRVNFFEFIDSTKVFNFIIPKFCVVEQNRALRRNINFTNS